MKGCRGWILGLLIGLGSLLSDAAASNFRLSDFTPIERSEIAKSMPQLAEAFPDAKFFQSGFTAASGTWRFFRIENPGICQGERCPTVIAHSAADWHVVVVAEREVHVTLHFEGGEFVECEMRTKSGVARVRYRAGARTIYIEP
jgi:hypothetical protein